MTSSFIFGDVLVENQNFPSLLKFSVGGKIEKLITKMSLDLQLTMILAEKLQFCTNFSQKSNKHSSTIVLP